MLHAAIASPTRKRLSHCVALVGRHFRQQVAKLFQKRSEWKDLV